MRTARRLGVGLALLFVGCWLCACASDAPNPGEALPRGDGPELPRPDADGASPTADAGTDAGQEGLDGGSQGTPDGGEDGGAKSDGAAPGPDGATAALTLTFSASPVDNLPNVQFAKAVPYGPEAAQVLDAFLPTASAPTPVVFFFHGGGFTKGSRTSAYSGTASALRRVVGDGAAFITVDYRLLKAAGTETEGVIKSLRDCMRSVQFVRRWAQTFNIRPDRVGIYGSSAGAGTSLWLAFHPEMADPSAPDLVLRQSTRVTAAAALSTQATYDLLRWSPDVFLPSYSYMTNSALFAVPAARELTVQFYGLNGSLVGDANALQAELKTPAMVTYRKEVDMLALLTADDPPTFVQNNDANTAPIYPGFDLLHHPLHAKAVDTRARAVGAELLADIPALNQNSPETPMSFLMQHLLP